MITNPQKLKPDVVDLGCFKQRIMLGTTVWNIKDLRHQAAKIYVGFRKKELWWKREKDGESNPERMRKIAKQKDILDEILER